jgi:glucan phosphoethanolaminetransferase (alkaline phosphatase superfamily)
MKNLIRLFYAPITIAKVICLALLFSPLWGLWWFNIESRVNWALLPLWIRECRVSILAGIIYISVCIVAFAGFVIVTFIRSSAVRVPLMLIMLIGWAFELSMLDLNGGPSGQNLFWVFWLERATALQAVSGYGPDVIRDCTGVVILGIVLCASPARRFSVPGVFGLLPIASGALVAGVIMYTKGATQVFPIPFGTFSNAAIVLDHALNSASTVEKPLLNFDPTPSRDGAMEHEVKSESRIHPIFNKIVMIMDESVRGDYLSLNDAAHNTTPFLKATDNLVNFGVAISGGNCSHIARTMFRFGLRRSDLPNGWREGLKRPTFWQFAHRAGYKTVYIDAWYGSLWLGNVLSVAERILIDSTIHVIKNPSYLRDQMLIGKLLDVLKDDGPAFIYVEKFGVHFPYSDKYPPDFHALPTPVEPGARPVDAFIEKSAIGERELAHYPNAIAWSVDEFFRSLLPAVDLSKTLIVYTSDHGQNLLPGHFSHCSTTRVPPGEAYVPLFTMTSVPDFKERLEKAAARGFGRFSHFEIFPTLLLAMGYDAGWVNGNYGPSLMDSPSLDRRFMIGVPDFQPKMIPVDGHLTPASSLIEPSQAQMPTADVN